MIDFFSIVSGLKKTKPLAALLLIALCIFGSVRIDPVCARSQQIEQLRVGVLAYSPPWYDGAFVDETLQYLGWKLPQYEFSVEYYAPSELQKRIEEGGVDIFAASSSFYMLHASNGLYDLGVLASDNALSPNRSAAAAVIVRSDRTDIQKLEDLKGGRVLTVEQEFSPGLHEVLTEAAVYVEDPWTFFGSIELEAPLNMYRVVERVLSGDADAGIVRACFIEDLWKAGSRDWSSSLRIINPQGDSDGLSCLHSTRAYPGWMFAATSNLTEAQARDITAALLTKPVNAWGQHWSMATEFSGISNMHKTLKIGPYAYLRDWTVERIIDEYWPLLLAAGLVLSAVLIHGVVLRILVKKRTRDLELAYLEQQNAERIARETSEKLDALQRLGAVGQISSIVAHEIKQPLATIQNLSQGAARILEDEDDYDETLVKAVYDIDDQAKRAAQIIDRVRSYSQGKSPREKIDLARSVARIVHQFKASRKGRTADISVSVKGPIPMNMVPIDLELIVLNLLSNASDAVAGQNSPKIKVKVFQTDGSAVVCVEDNGPQISGEQLEALGSTVLKSSKQNGLGLGVMIVKTLTEAYTGNLRYERLEPRGLRATAVFPLNPNQTSEKIDGAAS